MSFNLNKKKYLLVLCVCMLSVALAACGNGKDTSGNATTENAGQANKDAGGAEAGRVLTDAMGHQVTIPAKPERVIASYLEDNLVALGIKPVAQWSVNDGASIQGYLQGDLAGVPTIPHDLPFEAVESFSPDLIIMDSASMVEGGKYETYSKIAPTYVIGTDMNNDWRQELLTVGEIFDKKQEAQDALTKYDEKAKAAKEKIESSVGNPSVAAIWLVNNQFFVVSKNLSSGAVLYEDLGLKVPAVVEEISASATGNWSPISLEKLVELDADHIFLINSDTSSGSTALNNALWKNIPAVKNGNVYEYSPDSSWLYTGVTANNQIIDDVLESLVK
ncbi:iron-hydroxamate ABC transporter substrate-binding protein [Paenibacillus marinisediminis]